MATLEIRVIGSVSTTLALKISMDATVCSLASMVAGEAKVPLAGLRLCFRGCVLYDGSCTLSTSGISHQNFIVALAESPRAIKLAWVDSSNGAVPTGSVVGGYEANGGEVLYVARLANGGGAHPGKLGKRLGGCRAGYGGQESVSSTYQVLVATDAKGHEWPRYHPFPPAPDPSSAAANASALPQARVGPGGRLPQDALIAGWEQDGTRLYSAVGVDPHGGLCPGKIQSGWSNGCSVSWGGVERNISLCHCFLLPPGTAPPDDAAAPTPPTPVLRRFLGSIDELLEWSPDAVPFGVDPPPPLLRLNRPAIRPLPPGRPRVLHCHDMMGGYCPPADEGYLAVFRGWDAIDALIYFAHHRVGLPPQCWIDACHARGIPCLGTLITEGPAGAQDNATLVQRADEVAERLTDLCAAYGFDGFLINIEAPVHSAGIPSLVDFLQLLTICCKQRVGDHALTLWYDSVDITTGGIVYQNALAPPNQPFFDACDGLFTNYWWREAELARSAELAGDRRHDVFVGIDCFARGRVPYQAGACGAGVDQVARAGLSLAVFAPGWSLECGEAKGKQGQEAAAADERFWAALGCDRVRKPRP